VKKLIAAAVLLLIGSMIFMLTSITNPQLEVCQYIAPPEGVYDFRVVGGNLRVREEPSLESRVIGYLPDGSIFESDTSQQVRNGKYVFLAHSEGYSAICNLFDLFAVPIRMTWNERPDKIEFPRLITQSPVDLDLIKWQQPYGNTSYAYHFAHLWGYERYSQGLHGGWDLGVENGKNVPVQAGVRGIFVGSNSNTVRIKWGDISFIYQHLRNIPDFYTGQPIFPDTRIGDIQQLHAYNFHVHIEVRYKEAWIINPIYLFSEQIADVLLEGLKDKQHFYQTDSFRKWGSPLEQPIIQLGGGNISPKGTGF